MYRSTTYWTGKFYRRYREDGWSVKTSPFSVTRLTGQHGFHGVSLLSQPSGPSCFLAATLPEAEPATARL